MIRTLAFWAAIIGAGLLVLMTVAGAAAWPGYSHVSQYISELGATGAPHGRLVSLGGFLPIGVLLMTFAVLAALIPPRGVLKTLGCIGLFLFALGYLGAAFFPCDFGCRPETPSRSQVMHMAFGLAGYILAPLTLAVLGVASRKWPGAKGLFPLGLACAVVAGIAFFSMADPLAGLFQRVLEGSVLLWIVAFAVYLRRKPAL
ncbi:MAG: DUF998 domain-containing protein [Caulobacter sp.]|nr:DUF998 domain-containing protein [Caulobacter sp.]